MAAEIETRVKEIEEIAKEIILSGKPTTMTSSVIADIAHDLAPPLVHEVLSLLKLVNRITDKDMLGTAVWLGEFIVPPPVNRIIPTHVMAYLAGKMPEMSLR